MSEATMETVCRVCDHRPGVHDRNTECRHCGAYCDGTYDDDGNMLAEGWVTREVVLPKCDRDDCTEPVEGYGRRFCTPHRKEHGRSLLVQLEALDR
jgi:hypothetical protein